MLICVQFLRYARKIVSPAAVLPVVIAGLLLSAGYANYQSAPLPLGMYMPAAPLGFLLLLTAAIATLDTLESGDARAALIGGVASGLAIYTKQDFWIPAFFLVAASVTTLAWRREPASSRPAIVLAVGFLSTLVVAGVPLVATAGWNALPDIVTGYGSASIFVGRGLPTWERVATHFNVLLILAFLVCTALLTIGRIRGSRSRILAGLLAAGAAAVFAAHVTLDHALNIGGEASNLAAVATDLSGLRSTAIDVARELLRHASPLVLPVAVALLAFSRRHHVEDRGRFRQLAFVLALCMTAKLRRGFEYSEWFHFLLELPAWVLAFELLVPWRQYGRRFVAAGATVFAIGFGILAYWNFGVGFMTRQNAHEPLRTARGTVWVGPVIANQYRELDDALRRADPTGSRPLLVFGYASFNYFLDRPNPAASTAGLAFTTDPAGTIDEALKQAPLFLDNLYFTRGMLPAPRL